MDRHTVATPVPRGRGAATALGALGALTALVAVLAWTALAGPASAASSAGRPLRARAASLSVPELAGERIVYAYSGLRPPTALLSAIRAGEAAGVILFGPNISSLAQIRSVAAQLQRANAASPVHARLLLLVDQEGGEVRRLPGGPDLSEKQIGSRPDGQALAAQAGTTAGRLLRSVGFTVNLAPVLDVFRSPGDFIDAYGRSYSSRSGVVARLGGAFISAQQRLGVAATAKHFPGLGAAGAAQDTDQAPVTLTVSAARLRSVDEAPYRAAIAAGVKLVMTSWATYPTLDRSRPAGLSPIVIGSELRGRLGFSGVTITDAISAGALARYGGVGNRGVLAARAGADLILCSAIDPADNSPAEGATVLRALTAALRAGALGRGSAVQAAERVLALRQSP